MKKVILLAVTIFYFQISFSQSNSFLWSRQSHCPSNTGQEGNSIATDALGNVYVTGIYRGTSIAFGNIATTSFGFDEIFLTKYSSNGTVLWSKSIGGNDYDESFSVATDNNNNVFISGAFMSSSLIIGNDTLINSGGYDVLLIKFDSNGNPLWARSARGSTGDVCYGTTADKNGNIYITGYYTSSNLIFGNDTLIPQPGAANIFLVKYDPTGNVIWAKSEGGSVVDVGNSVATDTSCNVYITGSFHSPSVAFGNATLINSGSEDIFIAKYDSAGNSLWAKSAGGADLDRSNQVTTDNNNNVFITGGFSSSSIIIGNDTLINQGGGYMFLAKYNPSGTVLWTKSGGYPGPTSSAVGFCVRTDRIGSVYVVGHCSSTIILDSTTLTVPVAQFADPMFMARYDERGNLLCSFALGSGGDDQNAISVDNFGNAFIGGDFEHNPFILGSDTLVMSPGETIFVTKFHCLEGSTEINKVTDDSEISIYPNPTYNIFRIKISSTSIKKYSLIVRDLLGKEIERHENILSNEEYSFGENLFSGIYLTEIISDGERKVLKCISLN